MTMSLFTIIIVRLFYIPINRAAIKIIIYLVIHKVNELGMIIAFNIFATYLVDSLLCGRPRNNIIDVIYYS